MQKGKDNFKVVEPSANDYYFTKSPYLFYSHVTSKIRNTKKIHQNHFDTNFGKPFIFQAFCYISTHQKQPKLTTKPLSPLINQAFSRNQPKSTFISK